MLVASGWTEEIGNRFFHTNFGHASYGATKREFQMTLEENFAISGVASARLPTSAQPA